MLVLARNPNESVMIGDDVEVTVVEVRGNKVKLGFSAPKEVPVYRREVWVEIQQAKRANDRDQQQEG